MYSQSDISVIIPVFNGAKYVGNCLDSLLAQERKPCEIIVVDNGSTDDTLAVVHRYKEIRLLEELIPGASRARNKGAKEAKGSFLAFLDVDCQARRNWIKEAWRILSCHGAPDGLVGYPQGVNRNLWASFFQRASDEFFVEIQAEDGSLLKIDSKNFFIKRKVFWEIGGFDTSLGNSEDADLGIRLHHANYRIFFAPSVLVSHLNPTSLSSRLSVRREQGFFDYRIFRKVPLEEAVKYYPAFNRAYNRYIFLRNPPPLKTLLFFLTFLAEFGIHTSRSFLLVLRLLGLSRFLYPLYHLLMAFAIFQGKLYARRVEVGYITLGQVAASGKFSRRLT